MIDMFTRLCVSVFIKEETSEVVMETLDESALDSSDN